MEPAANRSFPRASGVARLMARASAAPQFSQTASASVSMR